MHWSRRRAYDVSAELAELDPGTAEWVRLGLTGDGRLAGLRFLDPARHVRGLA
jgi:hypothetical protein